MSLLESKVTLILQEKIAKFELGHQIEVLDVYSLTLEYFSWKICAYFYFGQLMLDLVLWLTWIFIFFKKIKIYLF